MVCTPAGFGKTSLLADWAASTKWPVAWLSLDPQDNDPVRFWRYVVGALDRPCAGLAEHVLPRLTPTSVIGGEVVVTALANQLQAAPETLALVLDDYHLIESRPIQEAMAYSRITCRRGCASSSAAVATRRYLWHGCAAGAPHAIAALEARTEGWGVGLQLAALSLREHADPDTFSRSWWEPIGTSWTT
jgi:LuxR family maltose regulon positive regulatory protein